MIYKYGIDFGTTNSSIAIRFLGDDRAEHTLVVDVKDTLPRETLPSVVLINASGKIFVGEEAIGNFSPNASKQEKQLFIKRIKLDLEKQGSSLSYTIGSTTFQGVDLIASILKALRLKAEKMVNELEIKTSGVVMGVPVQYGDIQKNVLKQALVKAGFYSSYQEADRKTEFVSEPVAVAVHYGLNLKHDKTVMVFDFGGGTLDIAIVNLKNQISGDRLHPHKTISKGRITLGGEELTRLFFINSFCSMKKYGTKRIASEFGFNRGLSPENLWEKLLTTEDGLRFIQAIDRCKCDLSIAQKYKFSFIGNNIQLDEKTFYRDDFSEAIEEKLDDINELIDECLREGKIDDKYDIDHVILAGGSSLVPAVQDTLIDIFGNSRVSTRMDDQDSFVRTLKRKRASESEVLTSIVRGLAVVGCRNEDLIDDVVDSSYGVWDTGTNTFIPIIEKGIAVKETRFDKLTKHGIYQEVEATNQYATSVEVQVYQQNLNGNARLGTINIPNPGGMKYRIYMTIDKKKGMLVVHLYDMVEKRWIEEIPLNERQYNCKH